MHKTVPKFVPSVRYINGLTIWFKSKHLIQVREGPNIVDFVRYANPGGGCYQSAWRPFCEKLYRLNSIKTIWDVTYIANNYDIDMFVPHSEITPIPQDIMVRPSIYKYQRKGRNENEES